MNKDDHQTAHLSPAEIARVLLPYVHKPLNDSELLAITKYLELLRRWNQIIPLTSIEDDAEIAARHFGESIFVGSLLAIDRGRLADVGSGAGFPGLPLKIAFPELQVTLIEPNIKKCAFLREVQGALGLTGVEIVRSRYEDYPASPHSFDFVAVRALGGYNGLLQWSRAVLHRRGRVILWLGIDDSILLSRAKGWDWELPVSIPQSRRRVILIGSRAS